MRVTFKCIGLLVALSCLFSCEKTQISQEMSISSQNLKDTIDFRGETVAISYDFPKEFLNQSTEDFSAYYDLKNRQSNLRTTAGEDFITGDEMLAVLQPLAKKYPDLSWDKEISEADLRRIYADFTTITTAEEVREKSDIILDFYNAMFKPEAVAAMIEYKRNRKRGKTSTVLDPFGLVFPYEESMILSKPLMAPLYMMSGATAKTMAEGLWKSRGRQTWRCLSTWCLELFSN